MDFALAQHEPLADATVDRLPQCVARGAMTPVFSRSSGESLSHRAATVRLHLPPGWPAA